MSLVRVDFAINIDSKPPWWRASGAPGNRNASSTGGPRHLGKTNCVPKNSLHGKMDCEFADTALSGDEDDGDDDDSIATGGGGVGSAGASGEGDAHDGFVQVRVSGV